MVCKHIPYVTVALLSASIMLVLLGAPVQGGEAEKKADDTAAAEAKDGAALMPQATGRFTTKVGAYAIENVGPWMRGERSKGRLPDLWGYYMHGVIDFFAPIVPWENQFRPEQRVFRWSDPEMVVRGNPYRMSPLPSLCLGGGTTLVGGLPVLDGEALDAVRGRTIRIFVWVCGEDTGVGTALWDGAPRVDVLLFGVGARSVVSYRGLMATRGTFPWHCFYRDVRIPSSQVAAAEIGAEVMDDDVVRGRGIYLRLTNPASGRAWFSTPSWELVDETNTYSPAERQDPLTGSNAPNPRFDELPVHLASPKVMHQSAGPAYEWAFLAGARRGIRHLPDVLSTTGFDAYLQDWARRDVHHMVQGVARLPEWYHCGMEFRLLSPTDGDWLEHVAGAMTVIQDEKTGFWGTRDVPLSMAVTAAVVERMFSGTSIPRADRGPVAQPWLSCSAAGAPRADAIVQTVLSLRGPVQAGWSEVATTYATAEERALDRSCSLGATASAVFLLRQCSAGQPPEIVAAADQAVRAAMEAVWRDCLLPAGMWKCLSTDTRPTLPGAMGRLLDASPMLERRVNPDIPLPEIAAVPPVVAGKVTIQWENPAAEAVSLRIYAAPADIAPAALTDAHLLGIIQRTSGDIRTADPLFAVQFMRSTAADAWGTSWFPGYGGYTSWKLAQLPAALQVTLSGKPLTLNLPDPTTLKVYACSTNWYGEVSDVLPIPLDVVSGTPAAGGAAVGGPDAAP